jgi:16S rRNA (adenine1518-N6/adenine1519-N6)-dimethyltransferase
MRETVRAKKHLGQHFLNDLTIAENIVEALSPAIKFKKALEIGPGMGVLTQFLLEKTDYETSVIDIDTESIAFLQKKFPNLENRIISGDFLKLNLEELFEEPFAIIGNFPYNISSQILFKMLEHRDKVPVLVGMFQKEVAERLAAPPKNKTYGILSVFLQAFYSIEYLFTVHENVFTPPPKVKSAVIRCTRNETKELGCDEKLFVKVVKAGFNQRRKTLRNSLKPYIHEMPEIAGHPFFAKRAEELSVEDFVELTNLVQKKVQ